MPFNASSFPLLLRQAAGVLIYQNASPKVETYVQTP